MAQRSLAGFCASRRLISVVLPAPNGPAMTCVGMFCSIRSLLTNAWVIEEQGKVTMQVIRRARLAVMLLAMSSGQAWAQACLVHSQAERLDIKVCQENINIPANLFKDSFCQPQLAGQKTETTYSAQCPSGAFGICRNAQVANMPYRENIHYYGVASDSLYLKPFCEGQSKGQWVTP
ncbi:putative proteinH:ubiquinone oxidoreductase 49 kD subunit 7 [Pseudomonas coronafaciens pv. garcae]|nr:putative proteinH:ubiquinone oxidoreductase 49 kD subunit 7 [Pseudomonas coronafaciens pv. garcae]